MEDITLSQIKSLNKEGIIALYSNLNIAFPPEADLEYLRSHLRILKLRTDKPQPVTSDYEPILNYINQPIITHESQKQAQTSKTQENIYDTAEFNYLNITPQNMTEKLPCYQPHSFSGRPSEDVQNFLSYYERVATANSWDNKRKLQLLSFYLTDTAKIIFENLERQYTPDNLTWDIVKQVFQKTFSLTTNSEILLMQLNSRVQLPEETVVQYMADVERLCFLVDSTMTEEKICGHIMKGLNPAILQQIAMWDNSNKDKLWDNISKYERASYLLRHRLGVHTLTQVPGKQTHDTDLTAKIDALTHMVNQLQFQAVNNRDRSSSRSRTPREHFSTTRSNSRDYHRDRRDRSYSNSRGRRREYDNDFERQKTCSARSRELDDFRKTEYTAYNPRVHFSRDSHSSRDLRHVARDSSCNRGQARHSHNSRGKYDSQKLGQNNNRPTQPCRHCHKMGHFSQTCWFRDAKN